jgi:hypothetical protein
MMSWISKSMLAGFAAVSALALMAPSNAASLPTGEHAHGNVSIEPAYDDMTGNIIYLQTPNKHAPLNPDNPTNKVNPHAVAPLYLVVYPPGTPGTFNCMGVPGNCPDHDPTIANVASSAEPLVYGKDPSLVPGHDHLVGVAKTGGDFNAPWHVFIELFTPGATVTHITTLSQLETAWASGAIDATGSGQGLDTGITFLCAVVSESSYNAGTPVG